MSYIKCPKCEMNYIKEDEELCNVCKNSNDSNGHSLRAKKEKVISRENIAFKCNYCNGGIEQNGIGFAGVCSFESIKNNIEIEKCTWCSADDNACCRVLKGEMTHDEFAQYCKKNNDYNCYESRLLIDWCMAAGVGVIAGEKKGKPNRLLGVQTNSLCVLTTEDPKAKQSERYIFGVFLVQRTDEGDEVSEGKVYADSKYRISLAKEDAKKVLFWNYYSNDSEIVPMKWGTGLFRYMSDIQSVQILRDIAKIKQGTADEILSNEFLEYFCMVNKIEVACIGEPSGALKGLK